jgi:hypothetical protein
MSAPHAAGAMLLAAFAFVSPALAQEAAKPLPTVLKGSATGPAPLAQATPDVIRYQVAAGEDLWLVNRETGRLVACELLNTSTVNRQIIRCWQGSLPGGF